MSSPTFESDEDSSSGNLPHSAANNNNNTSGGWVLRKKSVAGLVVQSALSVNQQRPSQDIRNSVLLNLMRETLPITSSPALFRQEEKTFDTTATGGTIITSSKPTGETDSPQQINETVTSPMETFAGSTPGQLSSKTLTPVLSNPQTPILTNPPTPTSSATAKVSRTTRRSQNGDDSYNGGSDANEEEEKSSSSDESSSSSSGLEQRHNGRYYRNIITPPSQFRCKSPSSASANGSSSSTATSSRPKSLLVGNSAVTYDMLIDRFHR